MTNCFDDALFNMSTGKHAKDKKPKADHKDALEYADKLMRSTAHPKITNNLAAAYLELRELAKAVDSELWDVNISVPTWNALRAAIGADK